MSLIFAQRDPLVFIADDVDGMLSNPKLTGSTGKTLLRLDSLPSLLILQ
jgi:hypothetical protein